MSDSMENSLVRSRNVSEDRSIIYQHDDSFSDFGDEKFTQLKDENKRMALGIMERNFNRNASDVLRKWLYNSDPDNMLATVYE
jgi:hypothetical protein